MLLLLLAVTGVAFMPICLPSSGIIITMPVGGHDRHDHRDERYQAAADDHHHDAAI